MEKTITNSMYFTVEEDGHYKDSRYLQYPGEKETRCMSISNRDRRHVGQIYRSKPCWKGSYLEENGERNAISEFCSCGSMNKNINSEYQLGNKGIITLGERSLIEMSLPVVEGEMS